MRKKTLFADIFILVAKFIVCCFVNILNSEIEKAMKIKIELVFLL